MRWVVAFMVLSTSACGDDDAGSPDAPSGVLCGGRPDVQFCDTFDEPGQDSTPFGFTTYEGTAVTTPDGDGLALFIMGPGGFGSAGPYAFARPTAVMRFDVKVVASITFPIGELGLGMGTSVATKITLIINDAPTGQKRLCISSGTFLGNLVYEWPTEPSINVGEWTTVEVRMTVTASQVNLTALTGPRGSDLTTRINKDYPGYDLPNTAMVKYKLGYEIRQGTPDTILYDNLSFYVE